MLYFAVQTVSSGTLGFGYLPHHNHRVEKDANVEATSRVSCEV
jgi:hypothetical protein